VSLEVEASTSVNVDEGAATVDMRQIHALAAAIGGYQDWERRRIELKEQGRLERQRKREGSRAKEADKRID
jgi:hypothetical protein